MVTPPPTTIDQQKNAALAVKGKGKLISPDNNYFMGEFIGSVKNGYGEIHYENGFSFKGYFANDKRNGYGQTLDKEGNLERYVYINDEKVLRI